MDVIRKSTHKNPTTPAFKKLHLTRAEVDMQLFLYGLNKGDITMSHDVDRNEIRLSISGDEDYLNLPVQPDIILEDPSMSNFFGSRRHSDDYITDGVVSSLPVLSSALADMSHQMWVRGTRRLNTFDETVMAVMGTLYIPGEMTAGTYTDGNIIYTGYFNIKEGSVAEARIKKAIIQAASYITAVLPEN